MVRVRISFEADWQLWTEDSRRTVAEQDSPTFLAWRVEESACLCLRLATVLVPSSTVSDCDLCIAALESGLAAQHRLWCLFHPCSHANLESLYHLLQALFEKDRLWGGPLFLRAAAATVADPCSCLRLLELDHRESVLARASGGGTYHRGEGDGDRRLFVGAVGRRPFAMGGGHRPDEVAESGWLDEVRDRYLQSCTSRRSHCV